ncbi:hypothetical protein D3C72_1562980 [compost metagenome]
MGSVAMLCMSISGLPFSLAGWRGALGLPPCAAWPMLAPQPPSMPFMSWPMPAMSWPMSPMVSSGRRSRAGIGACRPCRTARVPAAKPVRPMSWQKMVKASWPVGSTITSKVSAGAMRNSSMLTGWMYCPSAATTVIFRPGMRTSK